MEYLLECLLGLGLFLYGIKIMSEALKKVVGDKMKMIINKATANPFMGILIGFLLTTLIQSSSGTCALVVSLITAGLLNLNAAIFIILGANIGSPTTSIIIGLDITKYAPIIIFVGAIMVFFISDKRFRRIGRAILGFGLMFYGLECLGNALSGVKDTPFFTGLIQSCDKAPILSLLIGFVLTLAVQSSGATIGVIQKLYALPGSTISFKIVIAFILGANIGTIITGFLASLKGSKAAKRVIIYDVLFNVCNAILFMIILIPFANLATYLENHMFGTHTTKMVSYVAMIIKIVGVLIFVWFTKPAIKLLNKVIKVTEDEVLSNPSEKLNNQLVTTSASLALECAKEQIITMNSLVNKMFKKSTSYLLQKNDKYEKDVFSLEDIVDNYNSCLHEYLTKIPSNLNGINSSQEKTFFIDTIKDIERIGDHCTNIIERMKERYDYKLEFTSEAKERLVNMINSLQEMLDCNTESLETFSISKANRVLEIEPQIDAYEKEYRKEFLKEACDSLISRNDQNVVELLSNLERIGDHLTNIAEHIVEGHFNNK